MAAVSTPQNTASLILANYLRNAGDDYHAEISLLSISADKLPIVLLELTDIMVDGAA